MEKAGVSSPTDMDRIRLALQAYNFGADVYFSYLEKNGITSWSEKLQRLLPKWPAAKLRGLRTILFMRLPAHGITAIRNTQNTC